MGWGVPGCVCAGEGVRHIGAASGPILSGINAHSAVAVNLPNVHFVIPSIKLPSLLLYNCNSATVMNRNVNI